MPRRMGGSIRIVCKYSIIIISMRETAVREVRGACYVRESDEDKIDEQHAAARRENPIINHTQDIGES